MRGKVILLAALLILSVYGTSAATEKLYATSQACTPGGDCTVTDGQNTLGEEDSLRGDASGNWGQKEIIWTFAMNNTPILGNFTNATISIYNLNFSWILNGQSDIIMLEYCLFGSCSSLENFTFADVSSQFNRTYNAVSITSFQDVNEAQLRFHGDPQTQGPDTMSVFLDAMSIDVNYEPPQLNASSVISNDSIFALESAEMTGSCSCQGVGNCTDVLMALQDNSTGSFFQISTSATAGIYSNVSSYSLGIMQAPETINRTFNVTANLDGDYSLRILCNSTNSLITSAYSISNLTVNPNIYEVNIWTPNSTVPISINAGENITVRFNFTKNGIEIANNIEVINITVDNMQCIETPGLAYTGTTWEFNCTTDENLTSGLKGLFLEVNYTQDPGLASDTNIQSVNVTALAPPNVTTVSIDDQIDLAAGSTTEVVCNATAGDVNGDLAGATATFFFSANGSGDPDDNNFHYSTACNEVGGDGFSKDFTCSFDVYYYAVNGTWTCNVTATDTKSTSGSGWNDTLLNPLFALNISTSMISYSDTRISQVSNETVVNITNLGNMPINVGVWGFGQELSDNLSMTCQNNNISIEYEKFSENSNLFSQKTSLSSDLQELSFTIPKQTTAKTMQNTTFWQVHIPVLDDPLEGQCTGNVIFEAGPV